MLYQPIDIKDVTLAQLIEAQIVEGLANCKPLNEIATEIAEFLCQTACSE